MRISYPNGTYRANGTSVEMIRGVTVLDMKELHIVLFCKFVYLALILQLFYYINRNSEIELIFINFI